MRNGRPVKHLFHFGIKHPNPKILHNCMFVSSLVTRWVRTGMIPLVSFTPRSILNTTKIAPIGLLAVRGGDRLLAFQSDDSPFGVRHTKIIYLLPTLSRSFTRSVQNMSPDPNPPPKW